MRGRNLSASPLAAATATRSTYGGPEAMQFERTGLSGYRHALRALNPRAWSWRSRGSVRRTGLGLTIRLTYEKADRRRSCRAGARHRDMRCVQCGEFAQPYIDDVLVCKYSAPLRPCSSSPCHLGLHWPSHPSERQKVHILLVGLLKNCQESRTADGAWGQTRRRCAANSPMHVALVLFLETRVYHTTPL